METLLNFSGGVDSTYVLWHWLKSNPDKTLLVHHCHWQTISNRHDQESKAVADILKWMDDHGLTNYKYIETTVDIKQLGVRPIDHQIIAFLTGTLLLNPKYHSIKYILSATIKDEVDRLGSILNAIWADGDAIRDNVKLTMFSDKKARPTTVRYIANKYKHQLIKEMPKELFELTFYCRTPDGFKACGKCHTCKQVDQLL